MNMMRAKGIVTHLSEWGENALCNYHWDHTSFQTRLGSRYDYTGSHGDRKNFRTSSLREYNDLKHIDGHRQFTFCTCG